MSQTRVELVPWDPESPEHVARMVDQRIECGWHEDKVPEWQGHQRSGLKCIYWIVSFFLSFFVYFPSIIRLETCPGWHVIRRFMKKMSSW